MKKPIFIAITILIGLLSSCNNEEYFSTTEEKETVNCDKEETDEDEEAFTSFESFNKSNKLKSASGPYIKNIMALSSSKDDLPESFIHNGDLYSKLHVDLNKGAGGKYIYLYYTWTTSKNEAMVGLRVVQDLYAIPATSLSKYYPSTYHPIGLNKKGDYIDLNEGAGGFYVYLAARNWNGESPITGLYITTSSSEKKNKSMQLNNKLYYSVSSEIIYWDYTYYRLNPFDLNMGTKRHKKFIYLWYTSE